MLAYFLAIAVVFVSITLYLTAFFRPKIHRQDDFLWSSLGFFYALTLWICAERITGAVLLGQLAIVSLAIAFIWENRQLRQVVTTASESNKALEGFSILSLIASLFGKLPQLGQKRTIKQKTVSTTVKAQEISTSVDSQNKLENEIKSQKSADNQVELKISDIESQKQEAIAEVSSIIDKAESEVIDALEEIEEIVTEKIASQSEFLEAKISPATEINDDKNEVVLSPELSEDISSISDFQEINNDISDDNSQELAQKQDYLTKEELKIPNDSVKQGFFGKIINTITKPFKGQSKIPQNEEKSAQETVNQIIENIEKEEEIIDNFIDEKTTASEVEKAIADFELDDSPQSENEKEPNFSQVIDTEDYTTITNEDEILEEINPQISLADDDEYQIESSIKDDEDLLIDINELNIYTSTDNQAESRELKIEEASDYITKIKEIKEEENDALNLELADINFDSEEIPEEDTIDSLTDLTGIEIDDNLTADLDDLLAESTEDLGKTQQFFPTEKDSHQQKDHN